MSKSTSAELAEITLGQGEVVQVSKETAMHVYGEELRDLMVHQRRQIVANGRVRRKPAKSSLWSYGNRKLWKPNGHRKAITLGGAPSEALLDMVITDRLRQAFQNE